MTLIHISVRESGKPPLQLSWWGPGWYRKWLEGEPPLQYVFIGQSGNNPQRRPRPVEGERPDAFWCDKPLEPLGLLDERFSGEA